jgi:hypothetical protein
MPSGRRIHNSLAQDPVTDPEDRALVLRAKSGDAAALEELVVRHQAWIYNIAVRMLYHPQDAEDATQEILVKAFTALSSYEGRSSFRTGSTASSSTTCSIRSGGVSSHPR